MSTLKIAARDAATGPVVEITGDLDYDTAHELRAFITTLVLHPGQRLVLDLAHLELCDSSGIGALILARNHAQAAQAGVALAAVPGNTLRVLRILGLEQVFAIYPDTRAATRKDMPPAMRRSG
ncbi:MULTISPECIES: STAS domain-containing protein [unclassified Streptomyces]|uniref:STAS domain-containing protein n=1 Tax=unclassified Streptomyces TaxID=2593676 RepID=UPI0028C41F2C|nr:MULTISPECIES: STAS domain-containing protein [unclassified Streptomyces]WNO70306.1 STAS domain-containing protein [Streptomyces sp. AM8-1-1]